MAVTVSIKVNAKKQAKLNRTLKRAPNNIKQNIRQKWNVRALEFRRLMQDRHLSGGTASDRLARRSSTLFSSLRHEVTLTDRLVNIAVFFLDTVSDYAPTHEFGDSSRNIPARMNMRKEWNGFKNKFVKDAEDGIVEGLRNAG